MTRDMPSDGHDATPAEPSGDEPDRGGSRSPAAVQQQRPPAPPGMRAGGPRRPGGAAGGGGGMGGMGGPPGGRPGGGVPLKKAFVALENRDFRFLFANSLASMTGMQMMIIARGVLSWDLTHSFGIVGFLGLSFGLPMLLLSLFGGATADRVDKRTIALISQFANGLFALVTGLLIATGLISVPLLFAMGLLQGTLFAFMGPARQALLPEIVPEDQLMNAIALSTAATSAMSIFAPAAAGALIVIGDVQAAYFVQTALAGVAFLALMKVPRSHSHELPPGVRRAGVLHEIRGGVRYVVRSRTVLVLLAMAFVPALFAMPYRMVLPGFSDVELGSRDWFAVLTTTAGVGSLLGSIVIAVLTDYRRKPLLQLLYGLVMGAGLVALGVGTRLFGVPGAIVASVVLGFAMMGYQTLNMTMVLTVTDPRYMGRVQSIMMLTFSLMPLMAWPLGLAADVVGSPNLFVAMGMGVAGFLALAALLLPGHVFGETPTVVLAREEEGEAR